MTSQDQVQRVLAEPKKRRALMRRSHYWFFHFYFKHYVRYKTAPFQREIFDITTEGNAKFFVLEAFRNSGKSTIMSLSYPLWSILGAPQKKFVLIIARTQPQGRILLKNIKDEIEGNARLRSDLGPFREEEDEWRAQSIVIPKFGARIMALSVESGLRGLRHRQYRPDLIIADDLEDLDAVKQQERRDQLYSWFFGDVVPMGSDDAQFVLVGTRLHEDSLIMRLKQAIEKEKLNGIFKSYPLLNAEGAPLWRGRFFNQARIDELRESVPDEATYQREYLLRIISDDQRLVWPEWIKRYDTMPARIGNPDFQITIMGIDLAISEKETADFTAIVAVSLFCDHEGTWSAYIHSNPVHERMDFPDARERIKAYARELALNDGLPLRIFIEAVGYQPAMAQDLRHDGFPVEDFKVHGQDKRARLSYITHLIKNGLAKFPHVGCESLENELIGFGSEKHDDLADAFAIALHEVMHLMTAPSFLIAKYPSDSNEIPDIENEMRAMELRLADYEFARQQGRISMQEYCRYSEEVRDKRKELLKQKAKEQLEQRKAHLEGKEKQHEQDMLKKLMRKRKNQ